MIVGLNRFQSAGADEAPELRGRSQGRGGRKPVLRAEAPSLQTDVEKNLKQVEKAIADGKNVMPPVLDAVKAYATVGEICGVMRRRWGEYRAR